MNIYCIIYIHFSLPKELIETIFSHLDIVSSENLSQVSEYVKDVYNDKRVWIRMIKNIHLEMHPKLIIYINELNTNGARYTYYTYKDNILLLILFLLVDMKKT